MKDVFNSERGKEGEERGREINDLFSFYGPPPPPPPPRQPPPHPPRICFFYL